MLQKGADQLTAHSSTINALNVFPVPDGDTGTNMSLTIKSGIRHVLDGDPGTVGETAILFAKGLLMGARGNSGVILSQLFRGFSKVLENEIELTAGKWAEALQAGVDTAYKAVMKPVEGTILTVAKDAANVAIKQAQHHESLEKVLQETLKAAKRSLDLTPQLLPLLKEVGVVDSGGRGLVAIYEGFVMAISEADETSVEIKASVNLDEKVDELHDHNAHAFMKTEDIKYGYCTEFMVRFDQKSAISFNESAFRERLSQDGDSLLVVADDELLKVHVHTEKPGMMLSLAQDFGELIKIKVENMREQHAGLLSQTQTKKKVKSDQNAKREKIPYGIVTVAIGKGVKALFESIGATVVLEGGQTMNPSTEDLVKAIEDTHAEKVFILPNNSNIVMAASQAAEVVDLPVEVIKTKSIPQGMAALLAFNAEADLDQNAKHMTEAVQQVKSGQITYAVRDTSVNGVPIKKNDFIGLLNGDILASKPERMDTAIELLKHMINDDDEIVTLIYGENVNESEAFQLSEAIQALFEDVEIEIHSGGQPLYDYLIAVE
nr:DAK2 domain-containing protein [Pullulanibacillus pueri]